MIGLKRNKLLLKSHGWSNLLFSRVALQNFGADQAFVGQRTVSDAQSPAEMRALCWRLKNCGRIIYCLHVDDTHVLRDNVYLAHAEWTGVVRTARYAASVGQDGRLVKRFSAAVVWALQFFAVIVIVPVKQRQPCSSNVRLNSVCRNT